MLLAVYLFPVSKKNKKLKLSVCGSRSVKSVMLYTCIYDVEMSGNDI